MPGRYKLPDITPIINWVAAVGYLVFLVQFFVKVFRGEPFLPSWLPLTTNQVLGTVMVTGLLLSTASLYLWYTKNCMKLPPPTNLETIYGHAYKNEEVQLDGKKFDHCTFENVSFVYEGKALYSFDNSRILGNLPQVRSHNDVVHGALYLVQLMNAAFPGRGIVMGKTDEHGNPVP